MQRDESGAGMRSGAAAGVGVDMRAGKGVVHEAAPAERALKTLVMC
jgi:hypothetical protein